MKYLKFFPIIGLIIFAYLIYSIGIEKIFGSILAGDFYYLAIGFFMFFPITVLQALRWHLLLKYQGFAISAGFALKLFLIGNFYASVTPGKLGSFIRIPYLQKKSGKSLIDCSVNILLDRLFDIFSVLFLALTGLVFLPIFSQTAGIELFLIILAALILLFIFLKSNTAAILTYLYKTLVPKKFKAENSGQHLKSDLLKIHNSAFAVLFAFSIFVQVLVFVQSYFFALGFQINVPLQYFIAVVAFTSIVIHIPISVQGLGTREAMLLYFFSFYSVDPSKTVVFSIASLILLYLFVLIFGGFFALKEKW